MCTRLAWKSLSRYKRVSTPSSAKTPTCSAVSASVVALLRLAILPMLEARLEALVGNSLLQVARQAVASVGFAAGRLPGRQGKTPLWQGAAAEHRSYPKSCSLQLQQFSERKLSKMHNVCSYVIPTQRLAPQTCLNNLHMCPIHI